MVAFELVVGHKLRNRTSEVAVAERNDPVLVFLLDGANEPLRVRVTVGRSGRCSDQAHTRSIEELPNGLAPFPVASQIKKPTSI